MSPCTVLVTAKAGVRGIRVDGVAPGSVDAGFTHAAMAEAKDPTALNDLAVRVRLPGRMAKPEEIAVNLVWLASAAASLVIGQTLYVDGGFMSKK